MWLNHFTFDQVTLGEHGGLLACKLKGNSKPKGVSARQMPSSLHLRCCQTWSPGWLTSVDLLAEFGCETSISCDVSWFASNPPARTFSELYLEKYFSQQAHTSQNYHALWTEACGFNFSLLGKIRVTAIKPSPRDNFVQKWPMYSKSMNSGSVNRAKISQKVLKWH